MIPCPVHGERFIEPHETKKKDVKTGREWLVPNPNAGRCAACTEYNVNNPRSGRAKRQPLREARPEPRGPHKRLTGPGYAIANPATVNQADFARFLAGLENNPERASELAAAARRPAGVSRAAYGVAVRHAAREPMLNADPRRVVDAMERGIRDYRMPKASVASAIIVKPAAMVVGKTNGWWERRWLIYRLKYAKGFCIVTDTGDESKAFPTIGELKSAVVKSGWEIIR